MKSVSGKNWEEISVNNRQLEKIKIETDLFELISKIILYRNFDKSEILSIKNEIDIFNPFLQKKDFLQSFKTLHDVIENHGKILILGDYDVDGCISTSILIIFLRLLNLNPTYYIPNRIKDGYGANLKTIKKIIKNKPDLIIMLDCGSNSFESIKFLNSLDIKSIIIDHHEIYKPYPKTNNLINPKKNCDYNEYDYFCSAALTYFFIDLYIKKTKSNIDFKLYLTYVLIATVCDVMPLRKMNRLIAIKVLKSFNIKNYYVLNKIFELKEIKRPLTIEDFGYLIGPILNSAGRLKDPNIVVELIINENKKIKEKIIKDLILLNEKRKKVELNMIKEFDFNKIRNSNNVIIEKSKNFNEGLIGLMANKLKDLFNKPSIVMAKSSDIYKASARSTTNFNIGKYIKNAIDMNFLINGGGHNLAAGFSIKENKIKDFHDYIEKSFSKNFKKISHKYASKISFNAINKKFIDNLDKLSPFGHGNENPKFLLENVKIVKPKIIKKRYISFFVKSHYTKIFPAISFDLLNSHLSKNILYNKNELTLVIEIKENVWNNKKNIQLIVSDIIVPSNKA